MRRWLHAFDQAIVAIHPEIAAVFCLTAPSKFARCAMKGALELTVQASLCHCGMAAAEGAKLYPTPLSGRHLLPPPLQRTGCQPGSVHHGAHPTCSLWRACSRTAPAH